MTKTIISYNNSTNHKGSITHYERPDRVNATIRYLQQHLKSSLFLTHSTVTEDEKLLVMDMISNVHSSEHVNKIFHTESELYCTDIGYYNSDTFYTNDTPNVVIDAIFTLKCIIDNLFENKNRYGYALIRPPGHHCSNDPSGFCIVNNVMIAAKYCQSLGYERVVIADWDFHASDGSEALIKSGDFPNIYLASIHGYGELIYPGTGNVSSEQVLNIPIEVTIYQESRNYITDDFYLYYFETISKFISDINPDIIIISNGLDAHQNDPLEGMNLTSKFYVEATQILKNFNKPLLYVLEGGYDIPAIKDVSHKIINELEK